ncbi:MAG TPA: hypothetical protein VE783_12620 [Candidatus Limnocylindrales bacterium]|nr:hypothetical protein [Candidatus Limnocylindrales bacterium]
MNQAAQAEMRTAQDIIRQVRVNQSPNGICYTTAGEVTLPSADLEHMVEAIPRSIAAALDRKAYYFVPLAIGDGDTTLVAEHFDPSLSDRALCHRNIDSGDAQCVFISTRLLEDRFSIAFEFFINVGHAFVDRAGISPEFGELVWEQATHNIRGETSFDAFEFRKQALLAGRVDEKAKSDYLSAAFSDSIAIYLLSLYMDIDYYDLREREYPLLAPPALADRLKKVAQLFPPNAGFQFNILYKRRGS